MKFDEEEIEKRVRKSMLTYLKTQFHSWTDDVVFEMQCERGGHCVYPPNHRGKEFQTVKKIAQKVLRQMTFPWSKKPPTEGGHYIALIAPERLSTFESPIRFLGFRDGEEAVEYTRAPLYEGAWYFGPIAIPERKSTCSAKRRQKTGSRKQKRSRRKDS